jgi:hypothetical protein
MSNTNTENQSVSTTVPIHQETEIPATVQSTPLGKDTG